MAQGININNDNSPRSLLLDGEQVAVGGNANSAGLYSVGNKLYLDGVQIAESADEVGILRKADGLYFGGEKIGSATPPSPSSGLWLPPLQAASSYTPYNYQGLIDRYDALKDSSSYPGTITKTRYSEDGYGDYPLWHYEFTPVNYTKTFYVHAGIHGNEHDAPQTLLRIMDIICNHCNEAAYSRLKPLRDNVRFIVIPCVNPWGYDNATMNVPYTDWNGELKDGVQAMNMNRNADITHQYYLPQAGTGGNYPWQRSEVRHIKHVIETIGIENIDYLVDNHDGGDTMQHLWINYNMDGANAVMVRQLVNDLLAYEDRLIADGGVDYRHDGKWETGYCCDSAGYASGSQAAWYNTTLGALGSVCEYIGGYFGYSFTTEQMTRSLRIRANLLIYAYEMLNTKGWRINEPQDAEYFHFDYPIAITRQGLRKDGSDNINSHTITTYDQVVERWEDLLQRYPSYVTKSAKLGENSGGDSIYAYTLGSGAKKVMLLGGSLRWSAEHKETEYGIYVLAQYLCNDYIVNQSKFLKKIKQDYTIVVIPCIDFLSGGNTDTEHNRGLNSMALTTRKKWEIVGGKCVPTTYGNSMEDVAIFKAWLDMNQDALAIISGGEDTSGYAFETPKYGTDYMTQFILPMNQPREQWFSDYCTHLEDDRGEDSPDVESTDGKTSGDYAFDNYGIPTYYINLKVSQMWAERQQYMQSGDSADKYMYRTYETGRRIANIANFILMAGGDIQ